jgi:hypothetical protein
MTGFGTGLGRDGRGSSYGALALTSCEKEEAVRGQETRWQRREARWPASSGVAGASPHREKEGGLADGHAVRKGGGSGRPIETQ